MPDHPPRHAGESIASPAATTRTACTSLDVLMGAGFGALIPVTGVALVAYFVAPNLFGILAGSVLGRAGEWLDVFGAFDRVAGLHLEGRGPQSLTALVVWVVVPLVMGLWLGSRREVK